VLVASDAWSYVGAASTVAVLFAAALGLAASVRAGWRRTVGRRHDHYRRLGKLGTNAQVSFFSATLGSPPALRKSVKAFLTSLPDLVGDRSVHAAYGNHVALLMTQIGIDVREELAADEPDSPPASEVELVRVEAVLAEVIWVDRDYYVQALVDEDETILAFSVTLRSRRFRPRFAMPPGVTWRQRSRLRKRLGVLPGDVPIFDIRLGSSKFAALPQPRTVYGFQGVHNYGYVETHWFGNPGAYQHYALASNDAGAPAWQHMDLLFPEDAGGLAQWAEWSGDDFPDSVAKYREHATPNTFTVIGSRFQIEDYRMSYGPEINEVRTIP
jgi:hypothetical protein